MPALNPIVIDTNILVIKIHDSKGYKHLVIWYMISSI